MITDGNADYSRAAGGAAIGARLRRLSERFDRETAQIYKARRVHFEQRWFGLLNQIVLNGPMTVGEIASVLHLSHVSISQARRALEDAGLIVALRDHADGRRRLLTLTESGKALVNQLAPLWQALNECAEELNTQAGNVVRLLDRLEDALDARSLFSRVEDRIGRSPNDIVK